MGFLSCTPFVCVLHGFYRDIGKGRSFGGKKLGKEDKNKNATVRVGGPSASDQWVSFLGLSK